MDTNSIEHLALLLAKDAQDIATKQLEFDQNTDIVRYLSFSYYLFHFYSFTVSIDFIGFGFIDIHRKYGESFIRC